MLVENAIPTFSCAMVRTELLRACDWQSPVPRWTDWWLWCQLACRTRFFFLPHKLVRDEYTNYGTLRDRSFRTFVFALKYVCPICIAMIFLNQLGLI